MTSTLTIMGMALATYACRALPLLLLTDPARLPRWLRSWLEYLPPAMLAAMVAPELTKAGSHHVSGWLPYILCLGVALTTRRLLPALAAGIVGLFLVI